MSETLPTLGTWDNFDDVLEAGEIEATGIDFSLIRNPWEFTMSSLRNMTDIINAHDRAWSTHHKDDDEQLRRWKCRLHIFHLARRSVEYLVARERIDWDKVASDLGLMNAFRVASEQALAILSEQAEQADQSGA